LIARRWRKNGSRKGHSFLTKEYILERKTYSFAGKEYYKERKSHSFARK
jgi:hypothetical protein